NLAPIGYHTVIRMGEQSDHDLQSPAVVGYRRADCHPFLTVIARQTDMVHLAVALADPLHDSFRADLLCVKEEEFVFD
ncbi:MAG: hypothetical protein CVV34_04955, partial [Methanomicrobiales archaeon HGW-Methanomicrobiales-5]